MPKKKQYYPLLRIVLNTWVTNTRTFTTLVFKSNDFGSHTADAILLASVFIGHMDGKPMTASKLAMFAGIPRPTVIRKLQSLKRDGFVFIDGRGRVTINTEKIQADDGEAAVKSMARLINRTAAKLSKMDT